MEPDPDVILHALRAGGGPAERLADHMRECTDAQAAIVVDGSADQVIARLVAAGWTLDDGYEVVEGKRIRMVHPPRPLRDGEAGDG